MIKSLVQAENYLTKFVGNAAKYTGKDVTVSRMWSLLDLAGNPQDKLRVIHLAGTSGKTSTAYFMAALLRASGCAVGLTVSPHVSKITERIQINGSPIDDEVFCSLLDRFISMVGPQEDASYFEYMIAYILWSFVELGVDYAVVETGLGGLHDSTNVLRRRDKVCIITDIGLDHQNILGDTIAEIAVQKAGIIHSDNQTFMYKQSDEVDRVFAGACEKVGAKLNFVQDVPLAGSWLPDFQKRNWQLAKATYDYIATRDDLADIDASGLSASQVQVPGRMQEVKAGGKTFVLDGAHNQQKMSVFVRSFLKKYPSKKVPVLIAMKQGKEYREVINELTKIASEFICVGFNAEQDMPIRSVPASELAAVCRSLGLQVEEADTILAAVRTLATKDSEIYLVTGSFYFLSQAKDSILTL